MFEVGTFIIGLSCIWALVSDRFPKKLERFDDYIKYPFYVGVILCGLSVLTFLCEVLP